MLSLSEADSSESLLAQGHRCLCAIKSAGDTAFLKRGHTAVTRNLLQTACTHSGSSDPGVFLFSLWQACLSTYLSNNIARGSIIHDAVSYTQVP